MNQQIKKLGIKCPSCGKELIVLESSIKKTKGDKEDILCSGKVKTLCCNTEVFLKRVI